MNFSERLKQARLKKQLTQEQLASLIGVAKSTLNGYEKGNREPDFFKIKKLIEVLEVDANYLLCIETSEIQPIKKAPTEQLGESDFQKKRLIHNYDKLNTKGKEMLANYSDDLASMPKYTEVEKDNSKKQA